MHEMFSWRVHSNDSYLKNHRLCSYSNLYHHIIIIYIIHARIYTNDLLTEDIIQNNSLVENQVIRLYIYIYVPVYLCMRFGDIYCRCCMRIYVNIYIQIHSHINIYELKYTNAYFICDLIGVFKLLQHKLSLSPHTFPTFIVIFI